MVRNFRTRTQLVVLLLASMLLLTIVIGVSQALREQDALVEAERQRSLAVTGSVHSTIDAVSPLIRSLSDITELDARLQTLIDNNEGLDFITVVWPDGSVVYHSSANLKNAAISELTDLPDNDTVRKDVEGFGSVFLTATTYTNPVVDGPDTYTIVVGSAAEPITDNLAETLITSIAFGLGVMLAISILALLLLRRWFTQPLQQLTTGAQLFSSGKLDSQVEASGGYEFKELAKTLNQMSVDLRRSHNALETVNMSLEQRVTERTRDLMTVARVAAESATILDMPTLLKTISDLTRQDFDLYHAHIYLLDPTQERLVLAAGAGAAGEQMVASGHSIRLSNPKSLVARAARARAIVIANDVRQEEDFLPNPLLPETRSELAVALVARDELIGVLDVQDSVVDAFGYETRAVMETLAQLISGALSNARLFTEVEQTGRNDRVVGAFAQKLQTTTTVRDVLTLAATELGEVFPGAKTCVALSAQPERMLEGMGGNGHKKTYTDQQYEVLNQWSNYLENLSPDRTVGCTYDIDGPHPLDPESLGENRLGLSRPISFQGLPLGTINLDGNGQGWSHDDILLIDNMAERLTLALEQIRTQDLTRDVLSMSLKQARRLSQLNDMSAEIDEAESENDIYRVAAQYIQTIVGCDRANLALLSANGASLALFSLSNSEGTIPLETPIPVEGSLTGQVLAEGKLSYIRDLGAAREAAEAPALLEQGIHSAVILPLNVEGNAIGAINIGRTIANAFSEEEVSLLVQIASHLSNTLENRFLLNSAERRAAELQTVAQVSTQATTILDTEELLWTVSDLTREAFDLYHAHIYLYNPATERLELAAGAGEAGRAMVASEHNIRISSERSLVATAARNQKAVVVADVSQEPNHLPNPLLPNTRAEMAVPMMVGQQLIGVLDVQSETVGRFVEDDVRVMSTLAAQVAVAVNNATLFNSAERRAAELQTVAQVSTQATTILDTEELLWTVSDLTREAFDLYHAHIYLYNPATERLELAAGAGEAGRAMVANEHNIRISSERSLVATAARNQKAVVVADVSQEPNHLPNPLLPNTRAEMAVPMMVGQQLIGVVDVQSETVGRFVEDDIRVMSTLAAQVAVAVNNATLFNNAERRATELQTVAQVSTQATTILDAEELLWTVSNLTREAFDLYHAHIYLYNPATERLELAAGAGEAGRAMVANEHNIRISSERSLVATAARNQKAVVVADVSQEPNHLPNPLLPNTRAEMAVPMMVGQQLIGVVDVQSETVGRFAEDDVRVMSTLAAQVAVAVNNATLFASVESDARTRTQLHEIGQRLTESLEPEVIGKAAVEGLTDLLDVSSVSLLRYDASQDIYERLAATGEIPASMAEFSVSISDMPGIQQMVATRRMIQISDLAQAGPEFEWVRQLGYTATLIVPIIVADRTVAVLTINETRGPREFTQRELQLAESIGLQTGVALQNAYQYAEQVDLTDQLLEVDRIKSEFLASMSHELRTPLNSIIGYAEVLLDGIDGDLTEDMHEDVDAIHSSGKHLLSLINDVLDLAKIEAKQMDLLSERISLQSFISDVAAASRVLLKEKPVELVVDIDENAPDPLADPLRLRQILSNLISNAAKFTSEGEITIYAQRYDADPTMLAIGVEDTGIGISAENLPLVFDRFRQVDQSATRRHGGTGLGLAITRELVQMHGGTIWAESEVGVGSRFIFTLPAAND